MKRSSSVTVRAFGVAMLAPLALAAFAGLATAQTAAPKAGAAPAAAAPAADAKPQSAWVKLCEKGAVMAKDKDGKPVKEEHSICLTHHERIDAQSGIVLVSAAIRTVDEGKEPLLMVMVPLGMALPPGLQIGVYSKDMWDKIQKGEKVDDSKLVPVKMSYILCHSAGCTGEVAATPEMINDLKTNGGIIVYAVSGAGQPVAFPIPLTGFDAAMTGAAADNAEYSKQRRALMQQIADNQQKAIEEYRKQNDELQKTQGQMKPGTAAAPAAAGAAPAAKAAPAPAQKK